MNYNKLIFFALSLIIVFSSSCNNVNEESNSLKWQTDNANYFTNMKDSASYILYNIPDKRGGQSFYYKITKQGDQSGTSPTATDVVKVNYRGRLITGEIFDKTFVGNSPENDINATPAQFVVGQLIPGWIENLMFMKVGEIRTIIVPQTLGYGAYGASPSIPSYSTLRFEIQLVSIVK